MLQIFSEMIREATYADCSAIKELMQSEQGFWKDSLQDDVIEVLKFLMHLHSYGKNPIRFFGSFVHMI